VLRTLCVVSALALVAPVTASAQRGGRGGDAEIAGLLEDARRAYDDDLDVDKAEGLLRQALDTARSSGLRGRTVAQVHLQLGLIIYTRDKDRARTVDAFKKALREDPSIRIDANAETPTLRSLFAEAEREVEPPRSADRDDRARDDDLGRDDRGRGRRRDEEGASAEDGISHRPVKRVDAGESLKVEMRLSPDVADRLYSAWVYFKTDSAGQYRRIAMKSSGDDTFAIGISKNYIKGSRLSYYLVVLDRDENVIASKGDDRSPMRVQIEDYPSGDSLTGEEWGGEDEDAGGGGKRTQVFSLGLSLGTGAGIITENATPQNQPAAKVKGGFAPAPFHGLIEADVWVTPTFALGGFARVQIVEFTHAEGGRLKFVLMDTGDSRLVARVGGGFGKVRHLVQLGSLLDTTLEGPYFWTVGATYAYDLSKEFAFVATPDFYHLIGESPSFHFDLSVGVQLAF
jgi:hypothetical protein